MNQGQSPGFAIKAAQNEGYTPILRTQILSRGHRRANAGPWPTLCAGGAANHGTGCCQVLRNHRGLSGKIIGFFMGDFGLPCLITRAPGKWIVSLGQVGLVDVLVHCITKWDEVPGGRVGRCGTPKRIPVGYDIKWRYKIIRWGINRKNRLGIWLHEVLHTITFPSQLAMYPVLRQTLSHSKVFRWRTLDISLWSWLGVPSCWDVQAENTTCSRLERMNLPACGIEPFLHHSYGNIGKLNTTSDEIHFPPTPQEKRDGTHMLEW